MSPATLDPPAATAPEDLGASIEDVTAQQELDDRCRSLERLAAGRGLDGDELLEHRFHVAAYAAGENPLTGDPYYTAQDFAAWWQRAAELDARPSALGPGTVGRLFRVEIVPNALLRDRVQEVRADSEGTEDGTTLDSIADAIEDSIIADGTYLGRLLGINAYTERSGYCYRRLRWYMKYEQAASVARVIDVPLQEVGL